MSSLYCYPISDVLVNRFDIRDQSVLLKVETEFTTRRLAELQMSPIYGHFNLEHLQKIHHHIFQDVYPFAGKIRIEDIFKGSTPFCRSQFIQDEAYRIFEDLRKDGYLKAASFDEFSNRSAHYLAEINMLHPFREGNGRAQREFIRTLALNAGFRLEWKTIESERFIEASIRSVRIDNKALEGVIRDAIQNDIPDRALSDFYRSLDRDRGLER